MQSNRAQDFLMLFLHGDVVVLPAQHLDALLDRMMGDASADEFMSARGFLLDETAMPSIPLPLMDSPALAVESARH